MRGKYWWFWLAERLTNSLPSGSAYRCAERLADLQWRCSGTDRSAVSKNLSLALGTPISEHSPLVRDVFRNFGRYLVEFFTFHRTETPELTIEGYQHLTDARREGRGAIALTAHVGNWEVGAAVLRRLGFPVSVVVLSHEDPRLDRLFNRQRQRCGVQAIPLGTGAAHRSLRHLRSGSFLGMPCDRAFTTNGIQAMLCGRAVTVPSGPALLSVRSRTPAVPTFLVREGRGKFRLCVEPPIWPETTDPTSSVIQALTQRYLVVIERYLKRFPSQWLMFQPITEPVVLTHGGAG